jgi:hypothetical protein
MKALSNLWKPLLPYFFAGTVVAFILDNLLPYGSFLLGLTALISQLFFTVFPFAVAGSCAFIYGLCIDSIYLSIPFGTSALFAAGLVFFLKTFHTFFNRAFRNRWIIAVAIATIAYYLLLTSILPFLNRWSLPVTLIMSLAYNILLCRLWEKIVLKR